MKNVRAHRVFSSSPDTQQRVPAKLQEHNTQMSNLREPQTSENAPSSPYFLIWQLIDSAFPTGSFAHSSGLEAAWQNGEVRGRDQLVSFLEASLLQAGHSALPFTTTAWTTPDRLTELDEICDVFTTNNVANRASRLQGKAFLTAVERIFNIGCPVRSAEITHGHFAPVFGACLAALAIDRETTRRMFLFNHLRGIFAAAVRLNIVGPMEAQTLQHRLTVKVEEILHLCDSLTVDDVAQTAPLLDIWQGTQDRLYSRLFQS